MLTRNKVGREKSRENTKYRLRFTRKEPHKNGTRIIVHKIWKRMLQILRD